MRRLFLTAAIIATGCSQQSDPDVVAKTTSFSLSSEDIAPVVLAMETARESDQRPQRVEIVEQAARSVAIQRLLLEMVEDRSDMEARYRSDLEKIRRETLTQIYLQTEILPGLEVSAEDIEAHIEAHSQELDVQAMVFVWHIFREFEDQGAKASVHQFLNALRRRAANGESFGQLAEQYSQSETRTIQGRLGWIVRGRLAPSVEEVVFGLDAGEISDPVDLENGAAIFLVSERIEKKRYRSEDVRPLVERRLMMRAVNQAIRERLPEMAPAEDWIVIEREQLVASIKPRMDDEIILRIGEYEVPAVEFRSMIADLRTTNLQLGAFDVSVMDAYDQLVLKQLLYRFLVDTGYLETIESGPAIAAHMDRLCDDLIASRRAAELIRERAGVDSEVLRRFYDENRHLYQTPLLFKTRVLSVPISPGRTNLMEDLEHACEEVRSGEETLHSAAGRLSGQVADLGVLSVNQLAAIDAKVPRLVLDAGGAGLTVPFQLSHRLNVIEVIDRVEPAEQTFLEVQDRVLEDYIERHQQAIYADLVEDLLLDARFEFFEDAVSGWMDASRDVSTSEVSR